jgi:hypothetical protein
MANGMLLPVIDFAGMAEDEFNDWYDLKHIPERLRVPGIVRCERWIGTDRQKISVLALYWLASAEIPNSHAWKAAANTPWTERMRPHFRNHLRIVSKRYRRGAG